MKKRRTIAVKTQFIVSVITLIVIICSSFTLAMCMTASNILNENMEDGLNNRAADVSKLIEQQLSGYVRQMEDIASREDIRTMNWQTQQKVLSAEAKRIGLDEFQISYVDDGSGHKKGDTVSTYGYETNLAHVELFQKASMGDPYISDVFPSGSGDKMMLCFGVPVYRNDKIVGVLTGVSDAELLNNLVKGIKTQTGGYGYIINQAGVKMAAPDYEDVKKRQNDIELSSGDSTYEALSEVQKKMTQGQSGYDTYTLGEETYCTAYQPIMGERWSFAIVENSQTVNHGLQRFVRQILNVTIPALILGAIVSYLIGAGIGNPIAKLTKVTQQLAQGNLDVDVSTRASNEVRNLAENITQLVDRLKTYILYINEVSAVLDEIGRGNLIFELQQDYQGEFNRLKNAMNEIQRSLSVTISNIVNSAAQVNSGSEQIANGSQSLAQGTSEQANTVEQITGTVKVLASNSKEDAVKAKELSAGMQKIGDEVTAGNLQMQQMVQAMDNISRQSAEIGKIIKAIDDIAFQTNILALNAAVEAARAGTAGKGFTVVADEVRNLAAKSAEAAKSVENMIHNSMDAVKSGADIALSTADALQNVTRDVAGAVQAVEAFSERYQDQVDTLSQVEEGIRQISSVIQSNSATAEEAAASSEELSGQAGAMKALTDQFQIDHRFFS